MSSLHPVLPKFLFSLVWLPLGFMFFGLSLFFAHLNQTQAVSEPDLAASSMQAESGLQRIVDPRFPGSVPYVALRINDRLQTLSLRPEELPAVYLKRSQSRLQTAQYAWDRQDHSLAVTTLHKAHVYLFQSIRACQNLPSDTTACQQLAAETPKVQAELLHLVAEFLTQPSSQSVQQSLNSLQEQVHAL